MLMQELTVTFLVAVVAYFYLHDVSVAHHLLRHDGSETGLYSTLRPPLF